MNFFSPYGHNVLRRMHKLNMKIEGNKLIIEFDPDSQKMSKSGKSYMLGTSGGFKQIGDIKVSYNIIKLV